MKSLNSENDFCFPKIKEAFTVKLKMISVDHHFRFHQTQKNIKKYFMPKQSEHKIESMILHLLSFHVMLELWFHNSQARLIFRIMMISYLNMK
jgi:hypothetical protein